MGTKKGQGILEFVLLTVFVVGALAMTINARKKQDIGMFDVWCTLSSYIAKGCPDCRPVDPREKPCPLGEIDRP